MRRLPRPGAAEKGRDKDSRSIESHTGQRRFAVQREPDVVGGHSAGSGDPTKSPGKADKLRSTETVAGLRVYQRL